MRGLFDQVEIFLRLYVGGASVFMWSMRSFSALCRLKTWLWVSMAQDRQFDDL